MRITRRFLLGGSLAAYGNRIAAARDDDDPVAAFRGARFREALDLADRLLDRDPQNVEARLARTLVHDLNFHTTLAKAEYALALSNGRNDHRALSILPQLSFAEERPDLLDRYLAGEREKQSAGYWRAHNLRLLLERAGSGGLCSVLEPAPRSFQVHNMVLDPGNLGVPGLDVRVNGNKPVRLMLSSSASGLWLPPAKARAFGVSSLGEGAIAEPGMYGFVRGIQGFAMAIEAGGLVVRNVPVFESHMSIHQSCDGVIGSATFRDVLIRLTPSRQEGRFDPLSPAPEHAPGQRVALPELPNAIEGIRRRHLLLLVAEIAELRRLALMQFQAEANVVHGPAVTLHPGAIRYGQELWRHGYSCRSGSSVGTAAIVAGPAKYSGYVLNCDLSETSAKVGLPVDAVLGMIFLMDKSIAIDYRDGLLAFS